MTTFERFKRALKRTVSTLGQRVPPGEELAAAIDSADDWPTLERKLVDLRTRSRRRQQEVLERLQPLSDKVEQLLAEAKQARIRVIRDNLLRQAEGYMQQLEAEDQPAAVHGGNCALITNLLKQVRRAQAMEASGVTADAVEAIAAQFEDIVSEYEMVREAAHELDTLEKPVEAKAPEAAQIRARLGALTIDGDESGDTNEQPGLLAAMEQKLYAAGADQ